jgi:tRNA (cytosine49-C5)-methyltransferase
MENLPEKFLERLQQLIAPSKFAEVMQALANKPKTAIRANTLHTSFEELQKMLQKQDVPLEAIPWSADAFIALNKSVRELTETDAYKDHSFYIQNLSSMIPAIVLNPQREDHVLDIAAAPGSKTTQIAALMQNQGELIANDLSRKRLYKLKENLTNYGVTNTTITNIPGQFIWKKYPEYFDKVLVDAPCSMEGRINVNDTKSYQDWSPKKIKELSGRQKYLLRSAVLATKPGGTIIYSTCTLAPEENEGVIDWLLKKEGGAIKIETISIPQLALSPGLTRWQNKNFHPDVVHTARIYPSLAMEGFFIAKIKKIQSSFSQQNDAAGEKIIFSREIKKDPIAVKKRQRPQNR